MKFRIGIAYDRQDEYPKVYGPADKFAEFEPESTIEVMEEAIRKAGHIPIRLGGPFALLQQKPDVDVIWNIAEGYGSRNREAWVPVLCEMYDIPFWGSDAFSLSLSLNKAATKKMALSIGIPTPGWILATSEADLQDLDLSYPLFLKPNYEGTAKGISERSIAKDEASLLKMFTHLYETYDQEILIEEFMPGAEFTCAVIAKPLQLTPVLERGICKNTGIGIHALENDGRERDYFLSETLHESTEKQIQAWTMDLCKAMDIRHFARLDFKCDDQGRPFFLEINPLPTFGIDSTFAILAELEGKSYTEYLSDLLRNLLSASN